MSKKKRMFGLLLVVMACLLVSFEGKAQAAVEESLCRSISFSSKGVSIDKIYVIDKNHNLWSYEYGKTEKEFIMADAAQVGNGGCAVLKTDGTLWESPYYGAGWSTLDTMDWKCTEENLQRLPYSSYSYGESVDQNGQRLPHSYWDNLYLQAWFGKNQIQYGKKNIKTSANFFWIKDDNSLWGIGNNEKGQLGKGLIYDQMAYWRVRDNAVPAIAEVNLYVNHPVKIMENVQDVFAPLDKGSPESIFAKKMDGTIWQWGDSTPVQADTSTESWRIVKGLDKGKEYPRPAQEEFQNLKSLVVAPPGFAWDENLKETVYTYSYLKINTDNTIWIKGDFSNQQLKDWTQIEIGDILRME